MASSGSVIKKTGTFKGKSNRLGHGGRAAQLHGTLRRQHPGMPEREIGAIIGKNARRQGAAPGGPNYHGHRA